MQSFNLVEMWNGMAPLSKGVNILLAFFSVYSLWVIVDRAITLRSVRRRSIRFVDTLHKHLDSKNIDGALEHAKKKHESPVARIVEEAIVEFRTGIAILQSRTPAELGEYDVVEAVERVVERVKEREIADLKRGLGGLASISSAAPFIGLFGTVVGIINAFRSMAVSGQGGLGAVSAGIAEALFTTAVGLLVAIPAVMTFNYFTTVIERFVVDLNGVGSELVSYVLREAPGPRAAVGSNPAYAATYQAPPRASLPPPRVPSQPPPSQGPRRR